IKFEPLPADDPRRRRPDITKAQTLLNWQPTIPLQDGLKLMIEDFRQRFQQV
ncbi:MAG: SDR family NAD-dependent epimerase/dehydratase, partial [Aphanizomenon sp.]